MSKHIVAAISAGLWSGAYVLFHVYHRPIDVDPVVFGAMIGMYYLITLSLLKD